MPTPATLPNTDPVDVEHLSTWLSVTEFAARAGVSTKTVRRWIKAGLITAVRIGPKLIRINPNDLTRLSNAENAY